MVGDCHDPDPQKRPLQRQTGADPDGQADKGRSGRCARLRNPVRAGSARTGTSGSLIFSLVFLLSSPYSLDSYSSMLASALIELFAT